MTGKMTMYSLEAVKGLRIIFLVIQMKDSIYLADSKTIHHSIKHMVKKFGHFHLCTNIIHLV